MCVTIEEVEKVVESRARLTEEQINGYKCLVGEKLTNQKMLLEKILHQTTTTNGRVDELEDKTIIFDKHLVEAIDNSKDLRNIQDWMLSKDVSNRAFAKIGLVSGGIIGGILGLIQIIAYLVF